MRAMKPKQSGIGRRLQASLASIGSSVTWPDTPLIVAGAIGGPLCILVLTPLRNALVLASQDKESSILELYQRTFAGGLIAGWVGGVQAVPAACPQFVIMGPAFHLFKQIFGGPVGGVILAAMLETTISFPSQTRNAQMAFNQDQALAGLPGVALCNPFLPWGPGVLVHVSRNIVAMSGIRVLSTPVSKSLERVCPLPAALRTSLGDMLASICAAFISMPLNQLYNFLAVASDYQSLSTFGKVSYSLNFLGDSYLVKNEAGYYVGVHELVFRDAFMRIAYVATLYVVFAMIERLCVALWKAIRKDKSR